MEPDLSLVIPLYNEGRRLPRLEAELLAFAGAGDGLRAEAVLADDGSEDGSGPELAALARRLSAAGLPCRVERLARNRGKGAALAAGVAVSRGRWVLTLDADMACPARQVLAWRQAGLVDLSPEAGLGVAFLGSREHPASAVGDLGHRRAMGRTFNLITQLLAGLPLEDTQCGYKLYPGDLARECFAELRCAGWAHDVELLMMLQDRGCRLVELPVAWEAIPGSKISPLKDSLVMLGQLAGIAARRTGLRWLGLAPGQDPVERRYRRLSLAAMIAALAVVLATFGDYGVGWDAWRQKEYGHMVLAYWLSGGGDTSALGYFNLHLYGGLFEALAAACKAVSPWGEMETRHLLTALCGLLGAVGVWRLAHRLGGARAGFWAGLLLLLLPTYYGHMFINSKDVPFAVGYVWTLYYLIRTLDDLPAVPRGTILKLGLTWGCTLGVRVGGLVLGAYLLAAAAFWLAWRLARREGPGLGADLWNLFASLAPAAVLAWVVMLLAWPWAQHHPLTGPFSALAEMSHFQWPGTVLLAGREVDAHNLPWHYLPRYLAVKLPPALIGMLALAPAAGAAALGLGRGQGKAGAVAMVALATLFPPVYVIARHAVLYDGVRHLIFILPPLCVLAGLTLAAVCGWARSLGRWAPAAAALLAAAALAPTAWSMVRLHPYQYVYYNALTGGAAGAQGRYELDYWGTSFAEAARWLAAHLEKNLGPELAGRKFLVYTCGHSFSSSYFFPPFLKHTGSQKKADFFLGYTRGNCQETVPGRLIHTVHAGGATLCYVKDLRPSHQAWSRFKELLAHRGVRRLYSLDWRLASPNHLDWSGGFAVSRALGGSRPEVSLRVDSAPAAAWLGWDASHELGRYLAALGLAHARRRDGGLELAYGFSPPPGLVLLPAAGMSGRASPGAGREASALDRDWATAWSTGAPQRPGQVFLVDLGREVAGVCRLRLWAGSQYENPAELLVQTSRDGRGWQVAGRAYGLGGALFWDGAKVSGGAAGAPLEVGFPPRGARYLRLVQNGSAPGHRWRIRELAVYTAAGPAPALDAAVAARALRRLAAPGDALLAAPWPAAAAGLPQGRGLRGSGRLDRAGVIALAPRHAEQAVELLRRAGWRVEQSQAGGFALLKVTPGPADNGLTPLPVTAVRAESKLNPGLLPRLFDGDQASRWDSGAPQRPGMRLTLRLRGAPRVSGLVLRTRLSPADFPRGLMLEGLDRHGTWRRLGFAWRPRPPFFFNGSLLLADGRGHELLTFEPRRLAALRLTLTAPHPRYFWSVHELRVLAPGG